MNLILEINKYSFRGAWPSYGAMVPLHTGSQFLSPNYDMDVYMATLFEGEAWDLCCELGRAKS